MVDSLDDILARSRERVAERVGHVPECPFCERDLTVRRTVLGRKPLVDGVQMKCAGDAGCGFRPDFDVPISRETFDRELRDRDGQHRVDPGYDRDGDPRDERLRALGYLEADVRDAPAPE